MSRYALIVSTGKRCNRGQSLVEFALILPVLLGLIIGIYEFGRAWNVYQVLTNAAREGARLAVIPTSTESQVISTIEDGLDRAALDPSEGSISLEGMGDGTGTPATVALEYPYQFTFLGPIVAFLGDGSGETPPGSITLSTTVVMRNE
ncbi:MAG: TadE/TadG family type IV pilus assembly protein [Gemmatimonadota bacterium]